MITDIRTWRRRHEWYDGDDHPYPIHFAELEIADLRKYGRRMEAKVKKLEAKLAQMEAKLLAMSQAPSTKPEQRLAPVIKLHTSQLTTQGIQNANANRKANSDRPELRLRRVG